MPKRRRDGTLIFKDYPDFRPNLTPAQIFQLGAFGGTYWRPIYSAITKKKYKDQWKEFPKSWWKGLDIEKELTSPICHPSLNKYGVKSGTSLRYWESKGWIKAQDPYGWVQWYCRFFLGRRSPDDDRQISRWLKTAGEKSRFRLRLVNMLKKKGKKYDDDEVSPVIRQLLLQWAYELRRGDLK